jgi:excisionase family DNA binding protein
MSLSLACCVRKRCPHPLSISTQEPLPAPSTQAGVAPLAVPPREAAAMLSICVTRVYRLLRRGELRSYSDGRARRITVKSIEDYVARRLAAADSAGWNTWAHNPRSRKVRAGA